jgi:hypothetical protein
MGQQRKDDHGEREMVWNLKKFNVIQQEEKIERQTKNCGWWTVGGERF